MKTDVREIKITLETARRWYEQGGEQREIALGAFDEKELIDYRLPKTWEEYRTMKGDEGEKANAVLSFAYTSINGAFADYHDAEKHIAMMKLHLLRDEYRQGWIPDWKACAQTKYVIYNRDTKCTVECHTGIKRFLSFKDEKTAKEFLTNFRELIEQAGDLI